MAARILAGAGALLLSVVVGPAAALALAALTTAPVLFLGGGAAAALLVWLSAWGLLTHGLAPRRRRAGGVLGVLAVSAVLAPLLVPLGDPVRLPPLPPGAGALATGDGGRIAYGVLPARSGAARAAPVVALHGGPGVPDTAGLLAALAPLTADGHDVWSYDQRGTGRSSRLDDPGGYTTELAVADLEAVRRRTGAPRIILVGHSYGAYLAAAYHDAHPDRVERLVLSSPGALSTGGTGGDPLARLDPAARREVQRLLVSPRALLVYGLVQVDPASAHALTGDAEVDARQDRVHAATAPALHCPGHAPQGLHGNGFFANQVPQSLRRPALPPLERSADDARVPALVLKGRCDYLDWASAVEHLDAFPDSRLVYLPDAGHDSYRERPEAVVGAVRAFLGGGDMPGVLADPRTAPADYQRR